MLRGSATPGHSLQLQHGPALDRLLQGQQRLEAGLDELKNTIDRLFDGPTRSSQRTPASATGGPVRTTSGHLPQVVTEETTDVPGAGIWKHQATSGSCQSATSELSLPNTQLPHTHTQPIEETDIGMASQPLRHEASQLPYQPHAMFENLAGAMERSDFSQVHDLVSKFNVGPNNATDDEFKRSSIFIIHPASTMSVFFDALRAIVLLRDCIMVPYVIAWDVTLKGWMYIIGWIFFGFWCIDLIVNFFTGYSKNGNVVMKFKSIAKRYMRRDFFVDLFALIIEGTDLMVSAVHQNLAGGSLQVFKVLRFWKVARLIRIIAKIRSGLLVRISSGFSVWLQANGFTRVQQRLNMATFILKLLFVIVALGHLGACAWFGIQRSLDGTTENTWLIAGDIAGINEYSEGFYWSLTTMFSGGSHIAPLNMPEMIFSIVWIVMGAIFVTCITSMLAAVLIESHEKRHEVFKKLQALLTFMKQRKTPVLLSIAIQADFTERIAQPKPLTELDLPFIQVISPGLRASLRAHCYATSFRRLAYFRMLSPLQDDLLQVLASETSTVTVVTDGENVFQPKQVMRHAVLLARGNMKYSTGAAYTAAFDHPSATFHQASDGSVVMDAIANVETQLISDEAWFCELALLLKWETRGGLTASSDGELLWVSSELFVKVVSSNGSLAAVASSYAVHLSEFLTSHRAFTDVSHGVEHDAVLSRMHVSIRGGLASMPVLELLRRQQGLRGLRVRRKDFSDLEQEILEGESHLAVEDDGSISRCVKVVVLHLTNKDGHICVQLAECRNGKTTARLHLPGCKVVGDESPEDAIKRLLDRRLHIMASGVRVREIETTLEYSPSASFGVRTKYIKYIHTAELVGSLVPDETTPVPLGTSPSKRRAHKTLSHASSITSEESHACRLNTGATSMASPAAGAAGAAASIFSERPARSTSDLAMASSGGMAVGAGSARFERYLAPDGSKHAIAVPHIGDGFDPTAPVNLDRSTVRVFRWMDEAEFTYYESKLEEVETELVSSMQRLNLEQWHALLAWKLITRDVSVHVEEIDVDELPLAATVTYRSASPETRTRFASKAHSYINEIRL